MSRHLRPIPHDIVYYDVMLCHVMFSLSVAGKSILGIRIDGVLIVEPRKEDVVF